MLLLDIPQLDQVNTDQSIWQTVIDSFESVITQIMAILPNLIGALVILLVGWILSKVLSGIVGKILGRIGLDKLANRLNDTDFFKEINLEIRPIIIIKKFLYWTLMLIFILSAAETLGLKIVTEQIGSLVNYIPKLFTAFIILALGFYLADAVKKLVANACKSYGIPAWKVISNLVFYILLMAIAVTALNQASIDTNIITFTIFILIGGAIISFSIAYGFAARDILGSILTSFYTKYHFEIGQTIELDNIKGKIVKMDNISVTLESDDKEVLLPMKRLLEQKVEIYK